ncbi:MAG: hypothetical protein QNJ97_27050 [Myxococcota bacterium]|nr:hypothetical protein [Myxococcota bacterium]
MSWRNFYTSNLGQTTTTGWADHNFGPTGSTGNARAMVMSALQKFFLSFQGYKMTKDIYVYWAPDGTEWPHTFDGTDQYIVLMKIDDDNRTAYKKWMTPPHEAGHVYQKQLRGLDYLPGSCPSGGHIFDEPSNEACATTEGWAQFVALKSWYDYTFARPVYATHSYTYTDIENRAPYNSSSNSSAASTEGNVAKAFWDMFDTGADTYSPIYDQSYDIVNWKKIVDVWTYFPSGDDNAENEEEWSNMRDYHHNSLALGSNDYSDIWDALMQNRVNYQTWCEHGDTEQRACVPSYYIGHQLFTCIDGIWVRTSNNCEPPW